MEGDERATAVFRRELSSCVEMQIERSPVCRIYRRRELLACAPICFCSDASIPRRCDVLRRVDSTVAIGPDVIVALIDTQLHLCRIVGAIQTVSKKLRPVLVQLVAPLNHCVKLASGCKAHPRGVSRSSRIAR